MSHVQAVLSATCIYQPLTIYLPSCLVITSLLSRGFDIVFGRAQHPTANPACELKVTALESIISAHEHVTTIAFTCSNIASGCQQSFFVDSRQVVINSSLYQYSMRNGQDKQHSQRATQSVTGSIASCYPGRFGIARAELYDYVKPKTSQDDTLISRPENNTE